MSTYGFTVNCDGNATAMMAKINASLVEMGGVAQMESTKIKSSVGGITSMFGGLKNMLLTGLGMGAAFKGFQFLHSGIEKFHALEQVTAKIEANLSSTGGAAGMGMKELQDFAVGLSNKIQASRAEVTDMQSQLLTFPAITKDVFAQSMGLVADIAKQTNHGLSETAIMYGKALNDPTDGLQKMMRYGVMFTEGEKTKIKALQASGKLIGAQKFMMEAIAHSGYAGVAAKMFDADAAAKFNKRLENIQLSFGEMYETVERKLIPVIMSMMDGLKPILSTIIEPIQQQMERITSNVSGWVDYLDIAKDRFGEIFPVASDIEFKIAQMVGDMVEFVKESTLLKDLFSDLGEVVQAFMEFGDELVDTFNELIEPLVDMVNWLEKINKSLFHSDDQAALGDLTGLKNILGVIPELNLGKQEGSTLGKDDKGNAIKQNALNTSELGGAKGGLGESKIINIKIDTMQRIESISGIKDLKNASEDAIEVLIRAINNLAYSQSATM